MNEFISCPQCKSQYPWKAEYAGKRAKCKRCDNQFTIPSTSTISPPPEKEIATDAAKEFEPIPTRLAFDEEEYAIKATVIEPSPPPGHLSAFETTYATNPGRVKIHWPTLFRCYYSNFLVYIIACVVVAFVVIFNEKKPVPPWLAILCCVLALGFFFSVECFSMKRKMWSGDVCPGIVISLKPALVAVYADLTKGEGSYPAIKIIQVPFSSMTGGPVATGTRLATVSTYKLGEGTHWSNVDPTVVNCVTDDEQTIRRVLASIPSREWDRLLAALPHIEGKKKANKLIML